MDRYQRRQFIVHDLRWRDVVNGCSNEGGETWDVARTPFAETEQTVAGDVIVQGRSWNMYGSTSGRDDGIAVKIGTDQFSLLLFYTS